MKITKQIISIILLLTLLAGIVLSLIPFSAFATGLEHTHNYEALVTPPACTEKGYTTYTCTDCGASYTSNHMDAKGHNYGGSFACNECGYEAKVSVLGDSISTYSGISSVKNAVYPNSTVKSVTDTWWKQVVDELGGEVLKINASGGSRILSDEYFNGAGIRDGNHAAYRDRCVNLHIGNNPDVILVFMGTNDFSYHVESECEKCQILLACTECTSRADGNLNVCAVCRKASGVNSSFCNLPLGTADSVDISRETPSSSCEAYAIMLSKMTVAYPDAQIYCLGLLPRANPYQNVTYHDHGQPTAFNAELKKVAENAGAMFIDLEQCLDNSAATWSTYFGDAVHPTAIGMDKISEFVISGILGNKVYMVSSQIASGVTLSGKSWAVAGNTYEASVAFTNNDLQFDVHVTMNGIDITETAFDVQTGKINIDNVTGNIVIAIKAKLAEGKITWSVGVVNSSNGNLADMSSRIRTNMFTVTRGAVITAANSAEFCPVFYDKDRNFVYSPNAYDSDGMLEISAGQYVYMRLMVRNSENTNETLTPSYGENITVTFGSEMVSWSIGTISTIDGSNADNYSNRIRTGFIPIGEGVIVRAANNAQINVVFYDENYKILPTGNNCGWTTEWSSVNAPAATVYIRVAAKDESNMVLTVDYGKKITLTYGCIHHYESVVTAPTCTEQGYTTNTCSACGFVSITDYVDVYGHYWSEWIEAKTTTCTQEGSEIRFCNCGEMETRSIEKLPHSYVDGICTTCSSTMGGYVVLSADMCLTNVRLTEDLYIDLNGYDLSGTIALNGYKIYGMDSSTNEYTCDTMGHFSCVDENGDAIQPERICAYGEKQYLVISTEDCYSFHRFFVGVTHMSLKLDVVGLGYKAAICGDEMVFAQLAETKAFSFLVQLEGYNPVYRHFDSQELASGDPIALRIRNYDVENYSEHDLYAQVTLTLSDGTIIETEQVSLTFRWLTEQVDANYTDYTAAQLAQFKAMLQKFDVVKKWDIPNLI